jgi:hypothetical protein
MQLNVAAKLRYRFQCIEREVIMAEVAQQSTAFGEQLAGDAAARFTATNRHALDFLFGAQRVMLEEAMLASTEMVDRIRTELHLFSEFASKVAEAHSVNSVQTMGEECSRHQIDFLRRESERLFKHGERMIETTAKLMSLGRRN